MFKCGAENIPGGDNYIIIDNDDIMCDEYCVTHYVAVTVLGTFISNSSFNLPVRSPR